MNYPYNFAPMLPPPLPRRSHKALILAWAVEVIAIAMGLVLAIYAGIEGSDGGFMAVFVATLPFIALSIVEITKIPLVALSFTADRRIWRVLGCMALLCVTTATFENFVFGFERGFNERLKLVETADETVRSSHAARDLAEARIANLQQSLSGGMQRERETRQDGTEAATLAREDMEEVRRRTEAADAGLRLDRDRLTGLLRAAEQQRANAVRRCGDDAACLGAANRNFSAARVDLTRRLASVETTLRAHATAAEVGTAQALQRRDAALARRNGEQDQLRVETGGLRTQISEAQASLYTAAEQSAAATRMRNDLIDRSQLHRLSQIIFQSQDEVSINTTKRIFVTSLAAIVALIGTILAALHFASQRVTSEAQRQPRQGMVGRAIRGFLARRRRRMRISSQERLKLIYLPLDATERDVSMARSTAISREPVL
jgi:hypothetical protein